MVKRSHLLLLLAGSCASPLALADATAVTAPSPPTPAVTVPESIDLDAPITVAVAGPKRWSLAALASYASNLLEESDPGRNRGLSLELVPSYKLPRWSISADVIAEQDLMADQEARVTRTDLIVRYLPVVLNPTLKFSPALTLTPPLAQNRRERESLVFGAGLSGRLYFAPPRLSWLEGYGQLKATRNVHEFTTSTLGASNSEWVFSGALVTKAAFTDRWSLALTAARDVGLKYNGSTDLQNFELAQELGYAFSPRWELAVGHTNAGSITAANGVDSNVSFFDPQVSVVYTTLTLTL